MHSNKPQPKPIEESHANMEVKEKNADVRFEITDISERGVVLTGAGVLASVLLILFVLYFIFAHYAHEREVAVGGGNPSTAFGRELPPEPRLQSSPQRDLAEMRAAEAKELSSYRWIDRKNGIVAIPIERAIDIVAQRGIPAAPAAPPQTYYNPQHGDPLTGFEMRKEQIAPR